MPRLNLTLDEDTSMRLDRHARQAGAQRATLARRLIREALDRREAAQRRRKLAADYAADRADARELLADLERAELELLD
jgi:metal-responsive CopG/Arc/MetJ family transcriptional regulator